MNWRLMVVVSLVTAWGGACQREPPPAGGPVPTPAGVASPNANAAHYGSHGVSAVPTANAPAPVAAAAAPSAPGGEPAEHACACGATCHCGHCSGAVPGCHCKAEKAQQK
jgi:hypothetical protein